MILKKVISFTGLLIAGIVGVSYAAQAVLLVSLGMPDNALRAYFQQARQYHIPVVIRGLYTTTQLTLIILAIQLWAALKKPQSGLINY